MNVLRVEPSDTIPIRQTMLRSDFDYEGCIFPGDNSDMTFHLGGFVDGNLVSVASFYYEKNPRFPDHHHQYRLRGMATLHKHQREGLSIALMKTALSIISRNRCTLLWCNARSEAVGFYQKIEFLRVGEEFDVPKIGRHCLMVREISAHGTVGSGELKQ